MDIKYCIKCFKNDECIMSIVCSYSDMFDILDHYSKDYIVKAFILNNDKEI